MGTKHKPSLTFAISYAVVWFVVRVLLIPALFWWYAKLENKKIYETPGSIPKKCTAGSILFFGLNVYWWVKIIQWSILRHLGKEVGMDEMVTIKTSVTGA